MSAPLLRVTYEQVMADRCGGNARRVGKPLPDPAVPGQPCPFLNDPAAAGLDYLSVPAADRAFVTDLDLARVPPEDQPKYLDICEIRLLESCVNWVATAATSVKYPTFSSTYDPNLIQAFKEIIVEKWDRFYVRWMRSKSPAVGHAPPAVVRAFNPNPFYPGSVEGYRGWPYPWH